MACLCVLLGRWCLPCQRTLRAGQARAGAQAGRATPAHPPAFTSATAFKPQPEPPSRPARFAGATPDTAPPRATTQPTSSWVLPLPLLLLVWAAAPSELLLCRTSSCVASGRQGPCCGLRGNANLALGLRRRQRIGRHAGRNQRPAGSSTGHTSKHCAPDCTQDALHPGFRLGAGCGVQHGRAHSPAGSTQRAQWQKLKSSRQMQGVSRPAGWLAEGKPSWSRAHSPRSRARQHTAAVGEQPASTPTRPPPACTAWSTQPHCYLRPAHCLRPYITLCGRGDGGQQPSCAAARGKTPGRQTAAPPEPCLAGRHTTGPRHARSCAAMTHCCQVGGQGLQLLLAWRSRDDNSDAARAIMGARVGCWLQVSTFKRTYHQSTVSRQNGAHTL
jgi:hypothetical protein